MDDAQPVWPAQTADGDILASSLQGALSLLVNKDYEANLDPRQSGSRAVVTGMLKTPDGVSLRFARFAPPAGRRGTVCILPGRTEWIEKYFETVRDLRSRGFAVAILDWRGQGLSDRALSDRHKGHVGSFSEFDTRSRNVHARGRAAGLSAADFRARPFDGRDRAHSRRASWPALVRPHRAVGADARHSADHIRSLLPARSLRVMRLGRLRRDVRSRPLSGRARSATVRRQYPDHAIRCAIARNAADFRSGAGARPRRPDGRLVRRRLPRHARDQRPELSGATSASRF